MRQLREHKETSASTTPTIEKEVVRRGRQPLRSSHNIRNYAEVSPTRAEGGPICRFTIREQVLARWNDGQKYLGNIIRVDEKVEKCYIRFEDNSEHWAYFKDITKEPARTTAEIFCALCQGEKSDKPNEIVLCDNCGLGYHQKCHDPAIAQRVLKPDVKWVCQPCILASLSKRGGGAGGGAKNGTKSTAAALDLFKLSLPYDLSSLTWDNHHRENTENVYCYCGGPGEWFRRMLRCCRCDQWFHEGCIQCITKPLLNGDRFYIFACAMCNKGKEYIRRLQLRWEDIAQLALFSLTLKFHTKWYDLDDHLVPWLNKNWDKLQTGDLANSTKAERIMNIKHSLFTHQKRFMNGREIKKKISLWGLRTRVPPSAPRVVLPTKGQLTNDSVGTIRYISKGRSDTSDNDGPPVSFKRRLSDTEDLSAQRAAKRRKLSHKRNSENAHGTPTRRHSFSGRVPEPEMNGDHALRSPRTPKNDKLKRTLDTIIPWPSDYEGFNHPFKTVLERNQEIAHTKLKERLINTYHTAACTNSETDWDSSTDITDSDSRSGTCTPVEELPPALGSKKDKLHGRKNSKKELALLAALQAHKEREKNELEKLSKKPRVPNKNVVDKSTLDAVGKQEVPLNQLKSSVESYFGAADRLAKGERFKVLARRLTPEGRMQYLVEWEGLVT